MFGSAAIELVLGMIFFYFLLSILCSHIIEVLAGLFDWRAHELAKGIRDLLNHPTGQAQAKQPDPHKMNDLGDQLLEHAHIKALTTDFVWFKLKRIKNRPPAYIPAAAFSTTLIDTLINYNLSEPDNQQLGSDIQKWLHSLPSKEAIQSLLGAATQLPEESRKIVILQAHNMQLHIDRARARMEALDAGLKLIQSEYDHELSIAWRELDKTLPLLSSEQRTSFDKLIHKRKEMEAQHTKPSKHDVARHRTSLNDPAQLSHLRAAVSTLPDGPRAALLPLVDASKDDLQTVRNSIEAWFNAKMDRVEGAYKRRAQLGLWLLGLIIAAWFNADSLAVATALWHNSTLRAAIANQAQAAAAAPSPSSTTALPAPSTGATLLAAAQQATPQESSAPSPTAIPQPPISDSIKRVQQDVQHVLIFPIGWGKICTSEELSNLPNCRPQLWPFAWWSWLSKLRGFIITALAISLGAPFWFDLLKRVSSLRNNGPSPNEPNSNMQSSA